ncbi:unnamed protein product [Brassicogethes aeneus]|uniref:Uncharacterized protein n=1 Tax=Brassicogethes aeneus TaxID=1431903 RepID=A0A9P0FGP8_BRAAE|nr:unnamed protein product [Brassicogethes aeneus]
MGKAIFCVFVLLSVFSQYQVFGTQSASNIFEVAPNTKITILQQNSGLFPSSQEHYLIKNIGTTEVSAKIKYGTLVNWFGDVVEVQLKPRDIKILNNGDKPYYVTALKVSNKSNSTAVVCAYKTLNTEIVGNLPGC